MLAEKSTLVVLKVVNGSNFDNTIISFDGNSGEANIGGQWVNGRAKVNTADNVVFFDVNPVNGYVKMKDTSGKTRIVFDCSSGDTYQTGQVHDGETPESLDERFP